MLRIVARRLLLSLPLLLVVSGITFVLESFVPGDPARTLLGVNATPEQYEAVRQSLHLDQPLLQQYWTYLEGVFHGDFGRSIFTNEDVLSLIGGGRAGTLCLGLGAPPGGRGGGGARG